MLDTKPEVDAIIIDSSALMSTLPLRTSKSFEDYAALDVIPTIQAYSSKYKRTDVVFDVYQPLNLKAETRLKQGWGARRRVTGTSKMPPNWQSLLRDDDNKTELLNFLADKISEMCTPNTVIVTKEDAVCNQMIPLDELAPCNHEEVDTWISVHPRYAAAEGRKVVMIKSSDIDVLVITVSVPPALQEFGLQKLWITFGQEWNLGWIPVHNLNPSFGSEITRRILFFHASTGCNVVSAFHGKGKKSA